MSGQLSGSGFDVAPPGFELRRMIGRGASCRVYEAHQLSTRRLVALKLIDTDLDDADVARRFDRECAAMGELGAHPHIVTVFDAGWHERQPWIAMELCPAGSLSARLASQGPVSVAEAADVLAKIADALHMAHSRAVVHCDVKPANIMITEFGQPALGDFGISRLRVGQGGTSVPAGYTLDYAPPEVLNGDPPAASGDVYSLGVSVWQLLQDRRPFSRADSSGVGPVIHRILAEPLPQLTRVDVPADLTALLAAMTAKEPDLRPTDLLAVAVQAAAIATRCSTGSAVDEIQPRAAGNGIALPPATGAGIAPAAGDRSAPPAAGFGSMPPAAENGRMPLAAGNRIVPPLVAGYGAPPAVGNRSVPPLPAGNRSVPDLSDLTSTAVTWRVPAAPRQPAVALKQLAGRPAVRIAATVAVGLLLLGGVSVGVGLWRTAEPTDQLSATAAPAVIEPAPAGALDPAVDVSGSAAAEPGSAARPSAGSEGTVEKPASGVPATPKPSPGTPAPSGSLTLTQELDEGCTPAHFWSINGPFTLTVASDGSVSGSASGRGHGSVLATCNGVSGTLNWDHEYTMEFAGRVVAGAVVAIGTMIDTDRTKAVSCTQGGQPVGCPTVAGGGTPQRYGVTLAGQASSGGSGSGGLEVKKDHPFKGTWSIR